MRLPRVIGHRGAAAAAPENTLAGFRRAAELGAEWVELDVRLAADGRPVVIHDARLERTTSGRGRVAARDSAALGRLDAGAWFAPEFAGEKVPTLEEALDCLAALGLGANIEVKAGGVPPAELAAAVAAAVVRAWPRGRPPPLLTSFEHAVTAAFRRQAPDLPRGLLLRRLAGRWRARAARLGCVAVHSAEESLTPHRVGAVRTAGLLAVAYTVNDPARARELFAWGVDAVVSDSPHRVLAGL